MTHIAAKFCTVVDQNRHKICNKNVYPVKGTSQKINKAVYHIHLSTHYIYNGKDAIFASLPFASLPDHCVFCRFASGRTLPLPMQIIIPYVTHQLASPFPPTSPGFCVCLPNLAAEGRLGDQAPSDDWQLTNVASGDLATVPPDLNLAPGSAPPGCPKLPGTSRAAKASGSGSDAFSWQHRAKR